MVFVFDSDMSGIDKCGHGENAFENFHLWIISKWMWTICLNTAKHSAICKIESLCFILMNWFEFRIAAYKMMGESREYSPHVYVSSVAQSQSCNFHYSLAHLCQSISAWFLLGCHGLLFGVSLLLSHHHRRHHNTHVRHIFFYDDHVKWTYSDIERTHFPHISQHSISHCYYIYTECLRILSSFVRFVVSHCMVRAQQ